MAGPKIPTYGDQKVAPAQPPELRVGLNTFGQADTPEAAFGGGPSAEGVTRAGEGLSQEGFELANKERQRANDIAVVNADNQLNTVETSVMYDPDKGLMYKKGLAAGAAFGPAMDEYQQGAAKIRDTLQNEEQRASFDRMNNSRQFMIQRVGQRHVGEQSAAAQDDIYGTSLQNNSDQTRRFLSSGTGSGVISEDYLVNMGLGKAKALITDHMDKNGVSDPGVRDAVTRGAVSPMLAGIIQDKVTGGKSMEAQEFLDKYKGEMDSKTIDAANKLISRQLPFDAANSTYDAMKLNPKLHGPDGAVNPQRFEDALTAAHPDLTDDQHRTALDAMNGRLTQDASMLADSNRQIREKTTSDTIKNLNNGQPIPQLIANANNPDNLPKMPNGDPDYSHAEQMERMIYSSVAMEDRLKLNPDRYNQIVDQIRSGTLHSLDDISKFGQQEGGSKELSPTQIRSLSAKAYSPGSNPEVFKEMKDLGKKYADDRDKMKVFNDEWIAGRLTDLKSVKELEAHFDANDKSAGGFWNKTYGEEAVEFRKDTANLPLANTVGTPDAVRLKALMPSSTFAPDSSELKAVQFLVSNGVKAKDIGPERLKWAMGKVNE